MLQYLQDTKAMQISAAKKSLQRFLNTEDMYCNHELWAPASSISSMKGA